MLMSVRFRRKLVGVYGRSATSHYHAKGITHMPDLLKTVAVHKEQRTDRQTDKQTEIFGYIYKTLVHHVCPLHMILNTNLQF